MGKELELAKATAKGATELFAGKVVSRMVGIIGGFLVLRLLSPSDYGLIAIAMTPAGIFNMFSDWGVSSAMMKYSAEYKGKGKPTEAGEVIIAGYIFRLVASVALSMLCYLSANYFALSVFNKPESLSLIKVASLYVVAWALWESAASTFTGFERMRRYAGMMVSSDLVKAILAPLLVFIGYGAVGAIVGNLTAIWVAALFGFMMASPIAFAHIHLNRVGIRRLRKVVGKMFRYAFPLALVSFIGVGLSQYYSLLIASWCPATAVGNYSAAGKIVEIASYVTWPMVVFFPTFSKLNPRGDAKAFKRVFKYSIKYSSAFVIPTAALLMPLSKPISNLVFGAKYETAWLYLTLMMIGMILWGFGSYQIGILLTAQGETKLIAKLNAINTISGVLLATILVRMYGIIGLIIASLVAMWPSYPTALREIRKLYSLYVPFNDLARIYMATAIATIPTLAIAFSSMGNLAKLVFGTAVFVILYLAAVLKFGALSKRDLDNLCGIVAPLPYVNRLAVKVLKILRSFA